NIQVIMNYTDLQMTGRVAPCKNSNTIISNPRRLPRCYESAKAKFKKPGCGQACRAKAQTDQGVSNSWAGRKIPHPKPSCQNLKQTPRMPLKCENHSNLT
ncbi:MAG: hypothetical protein OIF56_09655, partial [Cohaesibacter sp.]|nr:hypothetical protein [Cohaesibacter sp.]